MSLKNTIGSEQIDLPFVKITKSMINRNTCRKNETTLMFVNKGIPTFLIRNERDGPWLTVIFYLGWSHWNREVSCVGHNSFFYVTINSAFKFRNKLCVLHINTL